MSGALDYLASRSDITGSGLGVVGFCMGGMLSLIIAAKRPDKIKAAGEANSKARDEARDKKRAEEDARSAANKAERDKNPPGSQMKKKLDDNAKAREEMQKKHAGDKKPKY